MYQERILLTVQDILDKEFKIDTRGYRPQEVDKFLDVIIRDYEEMSAVIKELESEKKALVDDNIRLKQELRTLSTKLDVIRTGDNTESNGTNTADVLRRLSNLEKIIYGRE
ncbi:MAG: cell division regulator GpsB [Firmicutes bacterium]|nr:cell division regulator GpsB [Bacillota bacterium]